MYEDSAKAQALDAAFGKQANQSSSSNSNRLSAQATVPKDGPISGLHTQRLFACLSELQQLGERLACSADRLTGPTPQAESGGNADAAAPSTLNDRLEFGIKTFGILLGRVRQEIERVERFV